MKQPDRQAQPPTSTEILGWLDADEAARAWLGGDAPQLLDERCNPSSRTWTIGARGVPGAPRLFVKMHSEQAMYDAETSALERLKAYADPAERYGVPLLVSANAGLRAIALEWLDGHPVGPVLREGVGRVTGARSADNAVRVAGRIGAWLQALERRTVADTEGGFQADAIHERATELFELVERRGAGAFDASLRSGVTAILDASLKSASSLMTRCLLHRDFWFDHIWLSGERVVVIDYGRSRIGARGRDAAQFYLRLADLATLNPAVSRRAVDRLIDAFVDGYGGFDPLSPTVRVQLIICKLEQLGGLVERRIPSGFGRAERWLHERAHVRWFRRFVHRFGA